MEVFSSEDILTIHAHVIDPNELQGLAADKSLDAVIGRVANRIHYGLIRDVYDLAATYAVVLAVGHVFNDADKRTAYQTIALCLELNGIDLSFNTEEIGQIIINVAQGLTDEVELARYLRAAA